MNDYSSGYIGEGSTLTVLDLTNAAQPARIARMPLPGAVEALDIAGDLVFVTDGARGLQIVDVMTGAAPVPRGS